MHQTDIATTAEAHEADALPRRIDTLPSGETAGTDLPDAVTRKPVARKSAAEWAYERLILYIRDFERQLDEAQEVAMGFAGSDAGVMRIEGLGYFDPDIVTFHGRDASGARTQLVQHVSQLSVLLRAMPKAREEAPPRRIGFELVRRLEEG